MPAVQYALDVWPGAADGSRPTARLQAIRAAMTSRLQFSPTWMPAMRPRLKFSFMSPLSQAWRLLVRVPSPNRGAACALQTEVSAPPLGEGRGAPSEGRNCPAVIWRSGGRAASAEDDRNAEGGRSMSAQYK